MDDIRGNSMHVSDNNRTNDNPETRRATPVVQGKLKKQSGFGKFLRSLIADDLPSVKEHILDDVLRPAISGFIINSVTDAISMIFKDGGSSRNVTASRVSYRDYYDDRSPGRSKRTSTIEHREDPTVPTRTDCKKVQKAMHEILDHYHYVRVSDLYDLCSLPATYTDNKYGWTRHEEIDSARFYRNGDGWYVIEMPSSHPLD